MMSTQERERRNHQRVASYVESARRINVSYSTFRRYVDEGRIKAIRLGPGRVGILESEIDRFLDEAETVA